MGFLLDISHQFPYSLVYMNESSDTEYLVAAIKEATQVIARLNEWRNMTDAEMRLRCGEVTAQEIRTVRAVLAAIAEGVE